ncbi:GNAT family N-acetyltransferase [Arenibacter echinorum]|uniref:Ribosomal protein S18 acetylase RimI-like enzyme n=1 Tax=Arenibacter echinorum TaxID=440515 RepID=A0A327QWF9_9FLAO|nr:GNAT family N-acetyltransferase [Arenibacter echinorum]RAJ08996.1 ribosomal protein S18 acetylase RimI-like enzyme [Arenibacter echinorum]
MKIEITDFEENDRTRLQEIYFEVRISTFTWLPKDSIDKSSFNQDTKGEYILVAKMENEIVGFASVWLQDSFLHHLYISNNFQGKGIGTMLLNKVIEKSNSDLALKCLKKNKLGIHFYLKSGWVAASEGISKEGEYILFKYHIFQFVI